MNPKLKTTFDSEEEARVEASGDNVEARADSLRRTWAVDAFLTDRLSISEAAAAARVSPAELSGWIEQRYRKHLAGLTQTNGGHHPKPAPQVSVLLPVFNEEENIPELYQRLVAVLEGLGDYELLFINDGSSDRSAEIIRDLQKANPQVTLINLSRNFGHQAAITAGLDCSAGKAVIILDSDLQDPPELIKEMLSKWRAGAKVVYAVRSTRQENPFKRGAYYAFYRTLRLLSHVAIPLDSGDCCLLDRAVVNRLNSLPERNRFLRGLRSWVGFEQVALPYERQKRHAGKPKYKFRHLLKLGLDGIFSFSVVPLRLATFLGLAVCLFGIAFLVFAVVSYFLNIGSPVGWTSIIALILIVGGTQLFICGILGEYLARIYDETKQRPLYVIESLLPGPGGV